MGRQAGQQEFDPSLLKFAPVRSPGPGGPRAQVSDGCVMVPPAPPPLSPSFPILTRPTPLCTVLPVEYARWSQILYPRPHLMRVRRRRGPKSCQWSMCERPTRHSPTLISILIHTPTLIHIHTLTLAPSAHPCPCPCPCPYLPSP